MSEPARLAKRVAELKGCSRREAEQYIEGGWVKVDGTVVEEPMFRVQEQAVEIDAAANLMAPLPVTLLLHKPAGAQPIAAPNQRASDDPSGIRSLKKHFKHLVAPAPLPPEASGLVVLSQDGRILRKLTEDAGIIEQELIAQVQGEATPEQVRRLCHGLTFRGEPLPPVKVSVNSSNEAESRLRFAIKAIRPEQVPGMCDAVGLKLLSLKRMRIGRVSLGPLPVGQWRYLMAHEKF
ncbi:MAG: RNA pseudouridine synthase [Pseudomonadota bacterium]|nr:RNA pseudouridine synthase [Pseudomonadota bacterium]